MRRLRREEGFTLLEALVALAVLGVITPALVLVLASGVHWSDSIQEESVVQTEVRGSLDRLTADLRQAYTGDATPILTEATPTAITFHSPDRVTPYHLRRISYRLVAGRLERSVTTSTNAGGAPWTFPEAAGPWASEVRGVRNVAPFGFVDADGDATTAVGEVHAVTVALTVPIGVGDPRTTTYTTTATLRGS